MYCSFANLKANIKSSGFENMAASTPHKFALLIPQTLAALPVVQKLPWPGPLKYLPKQFQLKAAEKSCNRLLQEQIDGGDLDFLENAILRVQIKDMGFDWNIRKISNKLAFSRGDETAATIFSGNSREFLLLASRREDPDTLFFQRRLSIEGDTELGLEVKNLIDSVDMDEMPTFVNHALYLSADFVEALPA